MVRMTPPTAAAERTHPPRERTLGLRETSARALMVKAYGDYAAAQLTQVRLHNAWRRTRRKYHGDDSHRQVKAALTRATKAALYLADAKARYYLAKAEAVAA